MYLGVGVGILCVFSVFQAEHLLSQTLGSANANDTISFLSDYTFSSQNTTTPTNVITWKGKKDLKKYTQAYFHDGNLVCDLLSNTTERTLINITFGCKHLFDNSGLGTGNFIAGFYAIRLAAKYKGNVDVSIHCPDALEERQRLLLPWVTGDFPANTIHQEELESRMNRHNVHSDDVCGNIDVCPIGFMFPEIQYELRRMAIALVGVPDDKHSTHRAVHNWLSQQQHQVQMRRNRMQLPMIDTPLYADMELDDVIVHFRCGDLMSSKHPRFAFLKYNAFASRISPDALSIGIVTQPFDDSAQNRAWDSSSVKRSRCKTVVLDFCAYLQEQFPRARIRIHNSPNETIALTYARMIMANQTIAGISTFGVFSSIASFGTGYIRLPDNKSATNQWLTNPPLNQLTENLMLMEEPNILMVRQVQKLWEEQDGKQKILSWFRDPRISY